MTPESVSPEAVAARLRAAGCVFAEDEARLLLDTARDAAEVAAMTARRVAGLPLEHVLGWAEFAGRRVRVDPGVFVPRRRTEFLVAVAAADAPAGAVVVDLCCGSGALGVALAAALGGHAELHAADLDPAAVRCAAHNVAAVGGHVHQGDLYAALPPALAGRVDVLLANAPYVPSDAVGLLPAEARLYEPLVALDGGADGLDVLRRVLAGAPRWLAPGGRVLVEAAEDQLPEVTRAARRAGLVPREARSEEPPATVVTARRPPAGAGVSPCADSGGPPAGPASP